MSKMFSNFKADGLEQGGDRLGGGAPTVPSGIYDATIKMAYLTQAASSKAQAVNFILDVDGKELRMREWISNKEGQNFYADKQDAKKKHPMPGFTLLNDICLFVTQAPLADQDGETKSVKVYSPNEGKEVPTPVPVLTALTGQPVKLAIQRKISWKQKKDDSGRYANTDQKITENTIEKAFHPETGRTVTEYMQEIETPTFLTEWEEARAGKDYDQTLNGPGSAGAGQSGSGRPGLGGSGAAPAPKKSLFG